MHLMMWNTLTNQNRMNEEIKNRLNLGMPMTIPSRILCIPIFC